MRVDGSNLSMIRGDSESITISCKMSDGEDRPFEEGDTVYFTVKSNSRTQRKALQKIITEFTDGKALIEIEPEDTKHLDFYNYTYDVQLTTREGRVITIIPPSIFEVSEEVTYE